MKSTSWITDQNSYVTCFDRDGDSNFNLIEHLLMRIVYRSCELFCALTNICFSYCYEDEDGIHPEVSVKSRGHM